MPKPKPNEKQEDFISRCIPIVMDEGTAEDNKQAAAICYSIWKEARKMTETDLVKAIRARKSLNSFNYGILTADRYVKTVADVIGIDRSYFHMAKETTSFNDIMEKAAKTLVYSNEDMLVEEKGMDRVEGIELPKNTLMVFKHILTTSRKDRDGDVLHTEGMQPDPKMLLLWQHVHTLPIGKALKVVEHDTKVMRVVSCIVDMNALCHDSAVMVDNGMGRFSHGFRAIEFDKVKEGPKGEASGFDIRKAEIMEESLVSVPANTDAETDEVLLSLVEGGKLTSTLMKDVGKGIRERRPLSVPVLLDLKLSVNGQEVKGNGELGDKAKAEGKEGVDSSSSEEADEDDGNNKGLEDESTNKEVKGFIGSLPNTWESIQDKLRQQVRVVVGEKLGFKLDGGPDSGYVYLIATFSDYVVACAEQYGSIPVERYFRCNWLMEGGEPKLYGDIKEVEIEVEAKLKDKLALLLTKAKDKEEKEKPVCPKCGSTDIKNGVCQDCGYEIEGDEKPKLNEDEKKGVKKGRVLSSGNEGRIREAVEYIDEGHKMDGVPKACKACMSHARGNLKTVLDTIGVDGEAFVVTIEEKELSAEEAAAVFLTRASKEERTKMLGILKHLGDMDEKEIKKSQIKDFLTRK